MAPPKGSIAVNKGKRSTHCKCGLPRTPENTNKAGYCKTCAKAGSERYKRKHPYAERGKHFQRKYGVSKDQFDAQVLKQGNKCAVCRVVFDYNAKTTTPTLDHAHDEPGKFRGVLCHRCNTGLGLFRDCVQFLQSAINYLKETQ